MIESECKLSVHVEVGPRSLWLVCWNVVGGAAAAVSGLLEFWVMAAFIFDMKNVHMSILPPEINMTYN